MSPLTKRHSGLTPTFPSVHCPGLALKIQNAPQWGVPPNPVGAAGSMMKS